jgi:hypothetical protein
MLHERPDTETQIVAVFLHEIRRTRLHKDLDPTVGVFLDVVAVLPSQRVEDLSSFLVEFLGEAQRERFAELLEDAVEVHLILEVLALLEDGNVRLSEDGKLGIDLLLGGARLRAKQLLQISNFLPILQRVGFEGCF